MKNVDLYLKVRHAVRIEGLSERATARRFGIDPRTVNKMMKFSVPPGYVRKKPPAKPKLDRFIPLIDGILGDDKSAVVDFRSEVARPSDNHRAGFQSLAGLSIFPFVPKTSGREDRRAIARREIPRLLAARGVLPFVISRHRDQAPRALECVAEERLCLDRFRPSVERRHLRFFDRLAPPARDQPPAH